jgi:hypothetical protein
VIAIDEITSPAQARKQRIPRNYVPDRPTDGFHVLPHARATSYRKDMDHLPTIREYLTQMESLDDQMLVLEAKADRIIRKLNDPDLARDYDEEHPLRLEAEERLDAVLAALKGHTLALVNCANEIHTHGHYAIDDGDTDAIDAIGRTLRYDTGPLGRVQEHAAGLLTGITWNRLYRAAVPF